ncbi:MAG: hypothetical protein WC359_12260 [Dehalococcoidia bacterium]|jgi:hypothetical protein
MKEHIASGVLSPGAVKVLTRPAEVYAAGGAHNLFTVNGVIVILHMVGRIGVVMPAGANAIQITADAVAMDDGLYDLNGVAANMDLIVPGNVAVPIVAGVAAAVPATMPWYMPSGNIVCTSAAGTTAGTISWSITYIALTTGTIVVLS